MGTYLYLKMQAHPILSTLGHVILSAAPDMNFVLLAIAGCSYLFPEIVQHLEHRRAVRYSVVAVFLSAGLFVVVVNAINREEQRRKDNLSATTVGTVLTSVTTIQKALTGSKVLSEAERKQHLISSLRDEYIISRNPIDPDILYGNKMPPEDWVNKRLAEMGETWTVLPVKQPVVTPPIRSYLAFDGPPRFIGTDGVKNSTEEGHNYQIGDAFSFNVHYVNKGPSPVIREDSGGMILIEPDYFASTQASAGQLFLDALVKEEKHEKITSQTMIPGDNAYFSPRVWGLDGKAIGYPAVNADQINRINSGRETVFILALVTYVDQGKEHHLRRCLWLQPPLVAPGVWHFCENFKDSD